MICYVGATCRYVAAFSEFKKLPATNPKDGIKRFPFLDYVRNFRKIHAILGDAPGGGANWNGHRGRRADSVMGPPCTIVAPIPGGIPYADNFGQKRDPPVRRSPLSGWVSTSGFQCPGALLVRKDRVGTETTAALPKMSGFNKKNVKLQQEKHRMQKFWRTRTDVVPLNSPDDTRACW